jgi:hypothetical protein
MPLKISSAQLGSDGRTVRLQVAGLRAGTVLTLRSAGLRSATGQPLRHDTLWHTLNQLPK